MRTLTIVTTGFRRPDKDELRRLEQEDLYPRTLLYEETLHSDILDERFLQNVPRIRRVLYKPLPMACRQLVEAFFIHKNYDAVISWSDSLALLFALLLKVTGRRRVSHVALMFWISKPKKAFLLKLVHSHISKIILWTSIHRDFAIEKLGIPAEKIRFVRYYVDEQFWRPMAAKEDMICSVGMEMRDYPTLISAMRGLPQIKCHIAAGSAREKIYSTVSAVFDQGPLPENVTVGKLDPAELRHLYARSKFVVVPLLKSNSDNGLTTILEAMAMGKPVICSQTQGQRDVVQNGKTGIFVPPGDSVALRETILRLWCNSEEATAMGREARAYVEANHRLEDFYNEIARGVKEVTGLLESDSKG